MSDNSTAEGIGVFHLLPELEHGGVEDHVVALANAQSQMGLRVFVVSGGGRLVSRLDARVRHFTLAVGRKDLFTGIACARKIASRARAHDVSIIHAHSRVPGWVAWFARMFDRRLKFIYTAHSLFSKNFGTWPIGRADAVICVSEAVRDDLRYRLDKAGDVRVIYNSLTKQVVPWRGSGGGSIKKLAFGGRLVGWKNLTTVLSALAPIKEMPWTLDVYGGGDKQEELEGQSKELGIADKVIFHGVASDLPSKFAESDCVLIPSKDKEGFGLVLAEALSAGAPVISSDTRAAREITTGDALLPHDNIDAWTGAIRAYLAGEKLPALRLAVELPTIEVLAGRVAEVYRDASA